MDNSTLSGNSPGPMNFNFTSNSTGSFVDPHTTVNHPNAIIMPIFIAIAIVVIYLPARDFYAKRNFAACSMIGSVTILNLYQFLNTIIWNSDDTMDWYSGVGLCDLEVNSRYMLTTSLVTSIFCFVKNLAGVFRTDALYLTPSMKRKRLIIDVLICWLVPFLQVAFHYLVSLGRFSIFPIYGCYDEFDGSWPYVVGYVMWFPIFTFLTLVYSGKSLEYTEKSHINILQSDCFLESSNIERQLLVPLLVADPV
jgi:pheromone a factor receptor